MVVGTVLALLTGIAAVRRIGASQAAMIGLLELVSAGIGAWLLLGEVPTGVQCVGGALLLAGIALTQRLPRAAAGPPELPVAPTVASKVESLVELAAIRSNPIPEPANRDRPGRRQPADHSTWFAHLAWFSRMVRRARQPR